MFYELTGFAPNDRGTHDHAPDPPDPATTALFLDFDGSLVDIADTPDAVVVPDDLGPLLAALADRFDGAVAIVTGRAAAVIERFVPGHGGDVASSHGAERRHGGVTERHDLVGTDIIRQLQDVVHAFGALDEGFLVEDKPVGVVLHFRRKPELYDEAQRFMDSLAGHFPDFRVQPAKMAFEIKPADIGKAASVRWLMERPPYLGRRPIYFGDDLIDEPAMEYCLEAGGAAVKVGEGETRAGHRLGTPAEVRAVLAEWAGLSPGEPS